jgi:uncharacterized membrane protein YedE/YeeE
MNLLTSPWPWYVTGPVIGVTVPLLLILGNKRLGISSTLRQICAVCIPGPTFSGFDWKKDSWNLLFAGGVLIGGFVGGVFFENPARVAIAQSTEEYLSTFGIANRGGLMPAELFSFGSLTTLKGFILTIGGGLLVGFGTRYAGGCTSGHGISGLSALQWPSLLATCCFFLGGIFFSYLVLPMILAL